MKNLTRLQKGLIYTGVFLVLLIASKLFPTKSQDAKQSEQQKTEEATTTTVPEVKVEPDKVINSDWDGSVKQVKDYLKVNLKDWDSYESIQWDNVVKYGSASTDIIGQAIFLKKATCKKGPDKSFPNDEDGEMDKGDKVYIIGKSNDWYKVRVSPNDSLFMMKNKLSYWAGWINGDLLKFVKPDNNTAYSVHHKYRSKNSFGGYVISDQTFYFDKNGNIIKVEQ